jgi:hypothetical protein
VLRRATLGLALGILTTIVVAWALALWPIPAHSMGSGTAIANPSSEAIESPLHRLCMEEEGRLGLCWIQFSVGTRTPGVYGIKWASLQGMSPDPETWHFTRADMPLILKALAEFPGAARHDLFAPRWPRWLPPLGTDPDDRLVTWGARAAGWPMLCLRSVSRASANDPALSWSWSITLVPSTAYTNIRDPAMGSIPLLPEPLGFTVNTALYSAAWSGLLTLPVLTRRALRRRRGLCPRCAYDLKGLPPGSPCPECGGHSATELRGR